MAVIVFACAKASAISYCKFLLDPPIGFLDSGPGLLTDLVEASHGFSTSSFATLAEPQARGLTQLMRLADRQRLKDDLDDPQRRMFQGAIDSVERVIIHNLRRQQKMTHDSLELLVFSVRLLAPRVADDVRVEIGKILIGELKKSPELGFDILNVLKGWRYRPNPTETVQIMRFMLEMWSDPNLTVEKKVRAFTTLPSMLGSIPDVILAPFIKAAYAMALNSASGFRRSAIPMLWALLELNPQASLSLAQNLALISGFHLPMPQSRDLQVGHATQIQFVYLYFLKVLKTPLSWLEREVKKFMVFAPEPTSPTIIQFRMLEAMQLNGINAQIEYRIPRTMIVVDIFIPHVGAKGKIVEIDGNNHFVVLEDFSKKQMQNDVRRDELLKEMGYVVRRLTNRQAMNEAGHLAPTQSDTTRMPL